MGKKVDTFYQILRRANIPDAFKKGEINNIEQWQELVDEIYYEFISPEEWHPYINERPN